MPTLSNKIPVNRVSFIKEMKIVLIILLFGINSCTDGQDVIITIEGLDVVLNSSDGYDVPRKDKTDLTFRNNHLLSHSSSGFVLQVGDDNYISTATNLNGAKVHGNKLIWDGDGSVHGMMAGYNLDYDIKHNYIDSCRYGVVHEGGYDNGASMVNLTGGIYYNIFKDCRYSIVEKGYDGTKIYNNTFYNSVDGLFAVNVKSSDTEGLDPYPVSANIKIFNNIFYLVNTNVHAIRLGSEGDNTPAEMDTVGFECDYNLYFCEKGPRNEPVFQYMGETLSWAQWRALGYDKHSVVVNPDFIDTDRFIPCGRLDYGTNLGNSYDTGLATSAVWEAGAFPETVQQHGNWQVGAVLYGDVSTGWGLQADLEQTE